MRLNSQELRGEWGTPSLTHLQSELEVTLDLYETISQN